MSVSLSTDLTNPTAVPYFLWDELSTVAEFRRRLTTALPAERTRLLAKLLREARDTDARKSCGIAPPGKPLLFSSPTFSSSIFADRKMWERKIRIIQQAGMK
jgi:hypothetical protein